MPVKIYFLALLFYKSDTAIIRTILPWWVLIFTIKNFDYISILNYSVERGSL